ncbi:hypothetical protein C8R45DRAFT_916866 [Mycena sanguinolenta]|nr:hypothetical protein C8R45DRAFT_916866 [Mycena sanguinolenta]
MDAPSPPAAASGPILLQSTAPPELSPQHSHHSSIEAACCPASIFNSCRQHGWCAYLSGLKSFFSCAQAVVNAERPPMFSIAQPKNRSMTTKANQNVQTPRGFAVRVFKGPTLSSFPYTATAKLDVGYRPTANNDPRQAQNWPATRPEPARQPLANIRDPQPSRFGSWTENRSSTPHPATNYADFIYERSLSSKSDLYSDNDTSSTTTYTPSSTFSPALSPDSTITSIPSAVPYQSPTTSASTVTGSPRHPFPLHIPALAQAQSSIRAPVPAAPISRAIDLPASSPPRFLPAEDATGPASPDRRLSESPQPISAIPSDYFPPPPSESEVGDAQRLAQLNAAQYNSASSSYYQASLRAVDGRGRDQSPERIARMGSSSRSIASSSFPTASSDSQRHVVYESSSLGTHPPTSFDITIETHPPLTPSRVARVSSESSSITAVEPEPRLLDSRALNGRSVPVSQLVELASPGPVDRERAERARVLSDVGRYEELRGLTMLSERQRETYLNAFAPGTQSRTQFPEVPAVVRSDSGESRRSPPERTRRISGNLWNSLPQLPDRRSPIQVPSRPSSTPPLPRIDTSAVFVPPPAPQRGPQPPTPINPSRSRTPVAGPRVLPAEPQRRRSDGDQPMGFLKRTSVIFHGSPSPQNSAPHDAPAPGPSRPAMPLDPQRRRSDGFMSVVPPRSPTPVQAAPRNVRWNENLVCPSPIFANQRRKGWFNRRGDQLWTNDGAYKPVPAGQEFPSDLRDYPPYGTGWMNEEGVRIDMGHRLIPKVPLRSALKQSRGPIIQVEGN